MAMWWAAATALLAAASSHAGQIDTAASQIGFSLKTRWGQTLDGRFPVWEGRIHTVDGGLRQVRLRLSATEVEIAGHAQYTRLTRGAGFFDAERFPHVDFVSDPYPAALARDGGELSGVLSIRGVARREVFTVLPAGCAHPGDDCDIVASGVIRRGDYAMDRWAFALGDRVVFTLRIRTREPAGK